MPNGDQSTLPAVPALRRSVRRSAEAKALSREAAKSKGEIETRCKAAGLPFEEIARTGPDAPDVRVGMRCGRDFRSITLWTDTRVVEFSSVQFEKYDFLAGYLAYCSYADGVIESAIQSSTSGLGSGLSPWRLPYRRLFGLTDPGIVRESPDHKIVLDSPHSGYPRIEISLQSETFERLTARGGRTMTLKLSGCKIETNDQAVNLLTKVAGATFFQIDLISNISLALERTSKIHATAGRPKSVNVPADLQYPKLEPHEAPLSLYSYGRGASGMPLLQFLAFYQVMEFYFPIYSQAQAQRKLKSILKDPAFRGDRDVDIARLLSAIRVSRGGGYGDEKSQLRATITECVEPEALRSFLESDSDLKEFYSSESKTSAYHKIPMATPGADLRGDVADRMYDIRCKIVHTKNDERGGGGELLLPYSKEADDLLFDIRLARYLAQSTLIAGSPRFQISG
jgi:hypothetical protein